jgi:hypothetical protein
MEQHSLQLDSRLVASLIEENIPRTRAEKERTRMRLRRKALVRAKRFSSDRAARQVLAVYKKEVASG